MKLNFRPLVPHIIAILLFITLAYAYSPALFEGKVVHQSDIVLWEGGANEIIQHRNSTGEEPLWTNSMFAGMPANMISTLYKGNFLEPIYNAMFVGERPASYLIIAMTGFYLLLLAFGINSWLAIVGAIAYAFCAYNFQIILAGHNSKMVAIAFMPMVLAGAVYAFRGRALLGAVLFGIAMSFEILASHIQITYYLGIILLGYFILELVRAYKAKAIAKFSKIFALLFVAGVLGVASNVNYLWPNWEYSKFTMRGGSEVTIGKEKQNDKGLSHEYATAWSYGIDESFNLLIPNYKGGSSNGALDTESETFGTLKNANIENPRTVIQNMPLYWGDQPFTAGPMYMGAVMVFLFVLGLCLVRGAIKWWLAGVSLLALMLGWGSNFMWFNEIMLDYLPMYNKFRAVSTTIIILQMTIPLLGIYTLWQIIQKNSSKNEELKALKIATGITAGFCLIAAIVPSIAGSFTATSDSQLPEWLRGALANDREALLRADAWRSLIFVVLTAGVVWLSVTNKLKMKYVALSIGALVVFDMWTIDKRYLNDDHFVTRKESKNAFIERPVDTAINADTTHYRVLDYTVSTFQDALVSYHHKSIGGYSAAKLQRYQDLIDFHIVPEMQMFITVANSAPTMTQLDSVMARQEVLNMLNTKYLVLDPAGAPLENSHALGNAWFVSNYKITEGADQEITALKEINTASEVVIDKQFENLVNGKKFTTDSLAEVKLMTYLPNRLEYAYKTNSEQLAVFSEIYYPKGWTAYVDGVETPIIRANYVLRAMVLPVGEHRISMVYKPESYFVGGTVSRIASIVLLLALVGAVVVEIRRRRK